VIYVGRSIEHYRSWSTDTQVQLIATAWGEKIIPTTNFGQELVRRGAGASRERTHYRLTNHKGEMGHDENCILSDGDQLLAVILGNPAMIDAFKAGVPGNGKPFPDGAKMAKIHWNPKKNESYPGQPLVPNTLHDVDFMVKDGKRFSDSGGWGYAEFEYDAASDAFRPGTQADQPPQGTDAKCGFACHTIVAAKDYVFTAYGKR
jgi:hypothetical protein